MAWGNFILDVGHDAAAALTKYRCVKFSAAEQVTPVTGIGDLIAGVVQFGVTTAELAKDKGASVRMAGVSEVEAAGAIAIGAICTLEADGRVSTYAAASGKRIVGRCVGYPSTNAGDRISMFVNLNGALA